MRARWMTRRRGETERCDYAVGRWRVRVAEGLLTDGESRRRLEPRVMAVLDYLVRHRGRPVPVDELVREVWSCVAVTDGAVVRAVAQLRKSLGDDPRRPRFLATLPRRGYVLIAEVLEGGGTDQPETGARPPLSPARAAMLTTAALLLLVFFASAWWSGRQPATADLLLVEPFAELDATSRQEGWSRALTGELAARFAATGREVAFTDATEHRPAAARVLSGSVRREGRTARVICRLSDGGTSRQICAGSCDLPVGSRLAAQRAAAESVADAVGAP